MENGASIGPNGIFLPFPQGAPGTILWTFGVLLIGLAMVLIAIYWLGPLIEKSINRAMRSFDLESALPKPLALLLGILWTALFVTFVLGMFWVMYRLALRTATATEADPADLRWYLLTLTAMTAALGAVVALPFTLLRTAYNRRQTLTAEENLTTDLINKAVEGLGAQKEVNTVVGEDDNKNTWKTVTTTEPNIAVRVGAIHSLDRIARQRAAARTEEGKADHIRIMEILCAYIREEAPASGAQQSPVGDWPDYPTDPTPQALRDHGRTIKDYRNGVRNWTDELRSAHAPRTDIQTALTLIGHRSKEQIAAEGAYGENGVWKGYKLDLRRTNLQAARLTRHNFNHANFYGAQLQGAELRAAGLRWTDLQEAQMQGAILHGVRAGHARFGSAGLQAAELHGAGLEEPSFGRTHLRDLRYSTKMQGALLLRAHMQGSGLNWTEMDGVRIEEAIFSDTTDFDPISLFGAGLASVNIAIADTRDERLPTLLAEAFGDASVELPAGLTAGQGKLDHWLAFRHDNFVNEWNHWLSDPRRYHATKPTK